MFTDGSRVAFLTKMDPFKSSQLSKTQSVSQEMDRVELESLGNQMNFGLFFDRTFEGEHLMLFTGKNWIIYTLHNDAQVGIQT